MEGTGRLLGGIMDTVILFRPDVLTTYLQEIESASMVGNLAVMYVLSGGWALVTAVSIRSLREFLLTSRIYQPSAIAVGETMPEYTARVKAIVLSELVNLTNGVRDAMIMTFAQYKEFRTYPELRVV
jgi:hypothetical protein